MDMGRFFARTAFTKLIHIRTIASGYDTSSKHRGLRPTRAWSCQWTSGLIYCEGVASQVGRNCFDAFPSRPMSIFCTTLSVTRSVSSEATIFAHIASISRLLFLASSFSFRHCLALDFRVCFMANQFHRKGCVVHTIFHGPIS